MKNAISIGLPLLRGNLPQGLSNGGGVFVLEDAGILSLLQSPETSGSLGRGGFDHPRLTLALAEPIDGFTPREMSTSQVNGAHRFWIVGRRLLSLEEGRLENFLPASNT